MARLLLVRHGEIEFNDPVKFWGNSDISLSLAGMHQAERLAERLTGEKIDLAYASPLTRAMTTAEMICAQHGIGVTAAPGMSEINFGEFEGMTFEEISRTDPDTARMLAEWNVHPRFPGGESIDELNARVIKFIEGLDLASDRTILIVGHAGTLRMLICLLLGLEVRHWRQLRLNMGSLSIIDTYPTAAILGLLNDVCHLEKG